MNARHFLPVLLSLAVIFPLTLESQTISGRLNTSFYTWDRITGGVTGGSYEKISHLRGFQTIRFTVTHGDLSLRTYSQFSTDFAESVQRDPISRIFDFHLQWRNIFDFIDVSIGRQPIFAGVGRGTIDGGSVRFNFNDGKYSARLYAGSLVTPFQSSKIQSFDDRRMIGGQITARPIEGFYASISYMDRHNKRDPYIATRADTLFNPIYVEIVGDTREFQLASLDASYQVGTTASLYGRFDYNLDDSEPQRIELFTRVHVLPELALTIEYLFREPLVPLNSIFRMFEVQSNQEIEGGIEYRLRDNITLTGSFASVMYDDDDSFRYRLNIISNIGSVSFAHTSGYAGELISLSAMGYYPLRKDELVLSAGIGVASYEPTVSQEETETAFSGLVGVSYKFMQSLSLDLQAQYLTNQLFQYDTRVFLRINYWFFNNLGLF